MNLAAQTEIKPAVCCACAQQCGLLAHIVDGRIVKLSGDKTHPSSAGFICPKGVHALDLHYAEDRIHRPLKRVGPRGSGQWEEIGWDQALAEIAGKIETLTAAHGRETLAYGFGTLHGADWGIGERFMNLFGSPNSIGQDKICYGPGAVGEALTYGFGPTFFTYPVPGKTRCMVVWGMRPSASAPLLWKQILKTKRAGAVLLVVDPEQTREAKRADLWLQIRPGTDAALALSLIHCVIASGQYDPRLVAEEMVGFEELRERAAAYAPIAASAITWVPPEKIHEAAALIASHGPSLIHGGNGLCQSGSVAVQNGRALACLIALTGNLNAEGGNTLAGPPSQVVANGDAVAIAALSATQRAKRLGAEVYPFIGAGYRLLDEAMSRAWQGKRDMLSWIATAHEPMLWDAILDAKPYAVKALILQHHNAVGSSANTQAALAALQHSSLELLVVHEMFMNATSRLADYVLPAAHWLEKPFFSVAFGYMGFAGDYVEAGQAPLAPSHQHRSDYDLWRDLGKYLGQADAWPDTAEQFWDSLLRPAGLDFETLAARRGPLIGAAARANPAARETPANATKYGTPSGKIELKSALLAQWGLDPLPYFAWPGIFAGTAETYPLVLTTGGRKLEGFHQHAPQMSCYRSKYPEPMVSMHAATAAGAGVKAGDWIRIETPIGHVRQRVRLTTRLAPNVIHADRWWYPEGGRGRDDPYGVAATNINMCTDDAAQSCDPIMGTWLLRGLPCRISHA